VSKRNRDSGVNFFLRHCSLSIIIVNVVASLVIIFAYHYLAPYLLNYPSIFNNMDRLYSIDYRIQITVISACITILTSFVLWFVLRSVDNWHNLLYNAEVSREKLFRIRKKCMNAPYSIFVMQLISISAPASFYNIVYHLLYKQAFVHFVKVTVIVCSFSVFMAIITFIFTKIIFTKILLKVYDNEDIQGERIDLKKKIRMLLIPLFIAIVLLSTLMVYSCILNQRGYFIFREYKTLLDNRFANLNETVIPDQILEKLKGMHVNSSKLCDFVISPKGKIITSDNSDLGFYFTQFTEGFSDLQKGRIYSEYSEINGAVIRIKSPDGYWIVGIKYSLVTNKILRNTIVGATIMILLGILIILFFIKAISIDVSISGKFLQKRSYNKRSHLDWKIPVTSNDEIGDLILAFNQIMEEDYEYDRLKTEFVANISHELRTPLSVLLGSLQLIEKNIEDKSEVETEKIESHISIMRQNCHRLLRLVNNFIDTTRIDAGYFQTHLKNCNIVSVVEEIVLSIVEYTKEQGLELYFDTEIEEKIMAVDTEIVERIILNLLSNAIKFAGKGSIIVVRIYDKTDHIIISFKDDGVGIPPEKLSIIFERFRQVDNLLTRKNEGSGIGLSLVKAFVKLLDGKISVVSEIGRGSEFLVQLPVKVLPEANNNRCPQTENGNYKEKIDIEFSDIK